MLERIKLAISATLFLIALTHPMRASAALLFFDDSIRANSLQDGGLVFGSVGAMHWQVPGRKGLFGNTFHLRAGIYVRQRGSQVGIHLFSGTGTTFIVNADLADDHASVSAGGTFVKPGNYEIYGFRLTSAGGHGARAQSTFLTLKDPIQFEIVQGKVHYFGRYLLSPVIRHVYPPAEENDEEAKLKYGRFHPDGIDVFGGNCSEADVLLLRKPWPSSVDLDMSQPRLVLKSAFSQCEKPGASVTAVPRLIPDSRWGVSRIAEFHGFDASIPELSVQESK